MVKPFHSNKQHRNKQQAKGTHFSKTAKNGGNQQPANTSRLLKSPNMNYVFYHEYYNGLTKEKEKNGYTLENVQARNECLEKFSFNLSLSPLEQVKNLPNYQSFILKTTYPGLMIGTGNPHDVKGAGLIKTGFSFDYVTGLPFLNGSSLKGILRSLFPTDKDKSASADLKRDYLASCFDIEAGEVDDLRNALFENADVFIGAYPCGQGQKSLLELDYITPHDEKGFKNPQPINTIKIKPNVAFEFGFILKDSQLSTEKTVTVEMKKKAFQTILMDIGIGAKTNIGYGHLVE